MKEELEKIMQAADTEAAKGTEKAIDLFATLETAAEADDETEALEGTGEKAPAEDAPAEEAFAEKAPAEEASASVSGAISAEIPEEPRTPAASQTPSAAAPSEIHVAATRLERNSKKGKKSVKPVGRTEAWAEKADKTEKPEKKDGGRAEKSSKKKGVSLTAIVVAAVCFLAVLFVFVLDTKTDEETGNTVTIAEYVAGEITGKTFMGQAEERLSRDMTPISVDEDSPLYEKFQSADRVNVLLLGVNGNMTDTIMLGSYDMANQKVDIISIPRDTYYYRSGYGEYTAFQKINSMWRTDGTVALATAVSELLDGMPIHYYVIVEYDDIRAVMKAIGGVQIDVPFAMKYDDTTPGLELHIDIPAGLQTIDESNVIEFLRFRHTNPSYASQGYKSYPGGDIQRIQVQQEFVKAVIKKCCSVGNILEVAKVILNNVDSDLDIGMATKIATKVLSGFSTENMESYTLPGADFTNELSFWRVNKEETTQLVEQIYGVVVEEEEPEVLNIEPGSRIRFVGIPQIDGEDGE